jgi:hypothetical protein
MYVPRGIHSQGGTRGICTYLIHSSPGPLNQADPQRTSAIPAAHGDLQCYPPQLGQRGFAVPERLEGEGAG